ncbi:MAG: hypothetical protein AVDCRST_MAG50-3098 [uncultured Acidimicrobiales bacterium]|uniref:Uncharacterized protein n=1 Tax=uncultured Acidimicrobiales bacterium TaxID=310071 RepID=A0A6J4IYB7_9ACTN|nr:MAG: hypothetical protein AVDCRST_MAG50-3098 [uncultured Acidimicrobiales bacterium]
MHLQGDRPGVQVDPLRHQEQVGERRRRQPRLALGCRRSVVEVELGLDAPDLSARPFHEHHRPQLRPARLAVLGERLGDDRPAAGQVHPVAPVQDDGRRRRVRRAADAGRDDHDAGMGKRCAAHADMPAGGHRQAEEHQHGCGRRRQRVPDEERAVDHPAATGDQSIDHWHCSADEHHRGRRDEEPRSGCDERVAAPPGRCRGRSNLCPRTRRVPSHADDGRDDEHQQHTEEHQPDAWGLGKDVDGHGCSRAGEQGAEGGQHEGSDGQSHRRPARRPPSLVHGGGVQQGGDHEPRDERCVLHWVPRPEAPPAELLVRPVGPRGEPQRQQRPREEGVPAQAGEPAHPTCRGFGADHGDGEDEGHHESRVAQVQQWRVVEHRRVLEHRGEAAAVERGYGQSPERA